MLDENTCPINLLLYLKFSPPIDFLSFRFRALWQNKYKRARRKSELCRLSKMRTSVESPEPFASHVFRFILDLTDKILVEHFMIFSVSKLCFGQNVFPGGKQWNKSGSGAEMHSSYVKVLFTMQPSLQSLQPSKSLQPLKSLQPFLCLMQTYKSL